MAGSGGWVLGVDSGGSGVRVAIARADGSAQSAPIASKRPAVVAAGGIDADSLLDEVLPAARELMGAVGAVSLTAAAVGAAGMATLGDDLRAVLPGALRGAFGVRALALAADAVTAYAGALGMRPGVVVAAGTGTVALGTGLDGLGWRRADGWGHLLGDAGSGAWIGRAGLESALRAHDGRAGGSAALLGRAEALFGPVAGLPAQLYPRADRPAVLASFAPEVARCAGADPVAADILRQAARHILETAAAARPAAGRCRTALTGGLFKMGEPLLGPLRELAPEVFPEAEFVAADGDPLLGALRIAGSLAGGGPVLPEDPALLHIPMRIAEHPPM
ncbi:BadF/BadG/BcrA/BcrD ATPase family protein [Streptomyces sp. H10-C2]|uniref:N-acetylglucosamine kinase n=1 Tax=unclassified Streptomyces TaxID=2593676 RepID=UPI0024BB1D2B|nr:MULTISPECIES: BadF/BadG/BcrA/BcrD ATPase family protein [unclassified Streptomyces]MDJ0342953.1 BadF/BadG/BcrA/BcrD ATPase family protein [Streptomyces sp. PH10-H1]MDJ0371485.1 BadF/BadG/BcrA/BcrD ATPase family protein [Streptomyces sp. H10-C2]